MYKWKNGIKGLYETNVEQLELFTNGIMLPHEYAISTYLLEVKAAKSFHKDFFPLFTSGGGDYRKAILQSTLLMVEGKLQREGEVIHVIVSHVMTCLNY